MNIVYALTRNVYEWILPSIRSLKEHNPKAKVYILCEDDKFPYELPKFEKPVTVINVSGQTYFPKDGVNYNNSFKYINLLKVRYPSILPDVDRVIHLDIDTIVCDDLSYLYNAYLGDKWFAAVQEYKGHYSPFGTQYCNAGVMLINLGQMRKDGIEQEMQDYLNTVKQPWADQDAWNKYGLRHNKIIPLAVNYNESQMTGYTDNPIIVHYCGYRNWWTNQNMYRADLLNRYKRLST